jgi:uncharacterized protein (TIGR03083 family)
VDLFAAIADERRQLADLLDGLTDEQWTTASCCTEWTVEDVAAHLTVVWHYSALDYMKRSLKNRALWFKPRTNLATLNADTVSERKSSGRAALVADIRSHVNDRSAPTGFGPEGPLTDIVVHLRDIALPLGITMYLDPAHALPALDMATTRRFMLFNNRSALKGLSFRATDIEWSSGTGPVVTGPAHALAHAMWGRIESLTELSGSGIDQLGRAIASHREAS